MALQISDTTPRIQYTATSGQTTFAVNFEFFDVADLKVYNGTTLLTYNNSPSSASQYSVTGAGVTGGGSITLGSPGATLNDSITIVRDLAIERLSDFPVSGNFPIQTLNTELDKIVAMLQQLEEQFARTLQYPVTTTTGFDVDLPELVANRVLSVNADATALLAEQELGTFQGDWAASTSYQVRDLVKDTSTGNIFFVNAAHTSSGSEPLTTNANSSKYDLIVDAESATTSATNAATSATAAASSATAAATSATNAATSESNAATSESNASTSETNASTSATNASNSATAAATSATNAATSESNASTSEINAATSATNAASSATSAASSATTATTQASAASTSATNAATSETNAATSASNASTSETNASTSATAAQTAQTAAEAAQTAAELAADNFDDTYLGAKASLPTVDNDGDALSNGDLVFLTTDSTFYVWTGSAWEAITQREEALQAIASTISETAVDIFIYDTRKDSDGGAWRKRTQNTSWYNETLNTSTRGSRKEFPQVAVIVAQNTSADSVTIYDGDDSSLPMWMKIQSGATSPRNTGFYSSATVTKSVTALNGLLGFTSSSGSADADGLFLVDFLKDNCSRRDNSTGRGGSGFLVSERNELGSMPIRIDATEVLIDQDVNDVAMTVLPNAPIDDATGLPIPTIAVATEGGVSVIKDDGNVVDSSATNSVSNISLDEKEMFYILSGSGNPYQYVKNISSLSDSFGADKYFNNWDTGNYPNFRNTSVNELKIKDQLMLTGGSNGMSLVTLGNQTSAGRHTGMSNLITSEFNTGWMQGDTKLATLSDTDDTNVTGSELVTNGDYATGDLTGWQDDSEGSGSATVVSNELVLNTPTSSSEEGRVSQQLSLTSGEVYVLTFEVITGSAALVQIGTSVGSANIFQVQTSGNRAYSATFTAGATNYLAIRRFGSGSVTVDNFSVRLAEEDRSVNNNGLQVFGTVTKSAVETGADLVGYSGWSVNNYFKQPYNSDLDFGTGDFSVMWWIYRNNTNEGSVFHRSSALVTDDFLTSGQIIQAEFNATQFQAQVYNNNFGLPSGDTTLTYADVVSEKWVHMALVRRSNVLSLYVDGKFIDSEISTANSTNTTAQMSIGVRAKSGNERPLDGSLALFRFSASTPTEEQIKKIYNDEKFLFQENAQATLYGTSDAVTALAFDDDTNLLHVGTSSGRSVFQGLKRVENTTDAVGSAISASNGMVADE